MTAFPTQGKLSKVVTSVTVCFLSRTRIHKEFEDGDVCTVTLKDRFKPQDEKEKLWYDQAFGPLRNLMKIELSFTPPADQVAVGKYAFFATITYTMFPELHEEFDVDKYPQSKKYLMEVEHISSEHPPEYLLELELPYGSYDAKLSYVELVNGQIPEETDDGPGQVQPL